MLKIKYVYNYPGKLSTLFFSPMGSTGSRNAIEGNKAARKDRMQLNTSLHNNHSIANGYCCFSIKI